jgi:hypothetical protein
MKPAKDQVKVEQVMSQALTVNLEASTPEEAEAWAMRVKDYLARQGYHTTVRVQRTPSVVVQRP